MGLVTLTSDLETGMPVASKVGNLPSKFGHARPLGSRLIRSTYSLTHLLNISYVRDGLTDGQTNKSNAYCPFPTGGQKVKWLSVLVVNTSTLIPNFVLCQIC